METLLLNEKNFFQFEVEEIVSNESEDFSDCKICQENYTQMCIDMGLDMNDISFIFSEK